MAVERRAGPRRFWLRAVLGLCAGLAAAAGMALYLGISQREVLAHLHVIRPEPLLVAALGGLILMALQALRWWMVMRPVLSLTYGQAYRAMMVGFFFNVLLPARGTLWAWAAVTSAVPKSVADQPGEVSANLPTASAARSLTGAAFHCSNVSSGWTWRSKENRAN